MSNCGALKLDNRWAPPARVPHNFRMHLTGSSGFVRLRRQAMRGVSHSPETFPSDPTLRAVGHAHEFRLLARICQRAFMALTAPRRAVSVE